MNTNIYILTLFMEMYKLYPIKPPLVSISTVNKFPKVFIQGKLEKQSGKNLTVCSFSQHYNNTVYYFLKLRYVDWLVTTFNENLPDENWRIPNPHPSAVSATMVDNSDNDYHRLVNTGKDILDAVQLTV